MTPLSKKLREFFIQLRSHAIFKDSVWLILSQVLSVFIQAAYFIIVARVLGSEDYGVFVGITAIVAIVFHFVGLGSTDIFIKYVARDRSVFRGYWGTALLTAFLSTLCLIPLILLVIRIFFSQDFSTLLVLFILLADLLGLKMWHLASSAFIAADQSKLAAQAKVFYSSSKLMAALVLLVFFPKSDVLTWGFLYCLGSIFPGILLVLKVNRSFGQPIFNFKKYKPDLSQGFFFSIAASAENVNEQIDKTMLVSLASPEIAGIYGAGYRFIDVGYSIIYGALQATYARFFRHGAGGLSQGIKFAYRLVPIAFGYGIVSAMFLFFVAPFVPNILGEEYAQSASVLRWLAPIHLIAALQFIAADTLTGANFHKPRSCIQVAAAVLNVTLNIYLIPQFAWYGAIWATLASECFKLTTLWGLVFFYTRQ